MRIIHLVRSTSWGGGERYALDLCREAAEEGHCVTAVTRGKSVVDEHFLEAGVPVSRMPLGGPFDVITPWKLARLVMEAPEERVVVHVHNFKDAELVARAKFLLGKRHAAKIWLVCTRHLVKRGKRSLRWKGIYKVIDRLIFISDLTRREFLSSAPPVDESRIVTVPNSVIVPQEYSVPTPPPECDELNILYTGRVAEEKGVDVLIKAAAKLSDMPLRLTIAGTGRPEYIAELKRLAAESGVAARIEWKGFVDDVFAEIRQADICVAPSVWREPFGLTILEFMSQGRPVVTTSNGAQPEIIADGGDGLLVPPGDDGALAQAIRRLAENPDLRKRIGEGACRTFSERFTYDQFYRRVMEAYGC